MATADVAACTDYESSCWSLSSYALTTARSLHWAPGCPVPDAYSLCWDVDPAAHKNTSLSSSEAATTEKPFPISVPAVDEEDFVNISVVFILFSYEGS